MVRLRLAASVAAALLLLTGCTDTPPPVDSPTPGGSSTPTPSPTPPPVPPTITIAFGGDVHFWGKTASLLDNPATAFGPVSEIFTDADLAMVNLETSIGTDGRPEPKTFTFQAPPVAFDAIKAAGIDVVSQANNHALDYGTETFAKALVTARDAGMPVVGAGEDASVAYAPWITTVQGVRIAFLGFSQIMVDWTQWHATDTQRGIAMAGTPAQIERAAQAVRAARAQADVVVVYMHWGMEGSPCPTQAQKDAVAAFADAGATMVLGTHAHVLLGDGWYGNMYVHYGLSNFLWYSNTARSSDTVVARVTLTGSTITKTELVPAKIEFGHGQPIPVTGAEADRLAAKYASLHGGCTGLADAPGPRP